MRAPPIKLNLGCGTNILAGWVNLDCTALPGVDVVHDLNALPLPFEDECADEILCEDVLEHVDYIPLLKECHRILNLGGRLRIEVPHFTSSNNFVDPTHRNMFSIKTFNFFSADTFEGKGRGYYFGFKFSGITDKQITFETRKIYAYNRLIARVVNSSERMRLFYEATGFSRLFPAENIWVTLIK
jgi:ubiquinone/menaquinone biosynthesis C-methylase UbiE